MSRIPVPVFVLLSSLFFLAPAALGQVSPERFDGVFDTWIDASGSHPGDPLLRVGKKGMSRSHAELTFDLDATVTYFNLDCSHLESIERAELVLDVESVTGCSGGGCMLRVRRGDGRPLTGLLRLRDGQTGEARFDVTGDVRQRDVGSLAPAYRIEQQANGGEVRFHSLESTSGRGPRIEITNRPLPDVTSVARRSATVFSETMSYLEAGDPNSPKSVPAHPRHSQLLADVPQRRPAPGGGRPRGSSGLDRHRVLQLPFTACFRLPLR